MTLNIRHALAFLLCSTLASGTTLAHTTVRSPATEGVTEDNAIRIGHVCGTPDGPIPIIAQSVVFPSTAPTLSTSDGSSVGGLATVIEQGTIAGLVRAIQDRSVFRGQQVKRDPLGNMTGFSNTNGALGVDAQGRVPFQFVAPKFVATSCAKRLLIQVAVANVCIYGSGLADSVKAGKVDLWIPDNGSQFATAGKAQNVDGVGTPATLTVNRNLATNPLLPACGAGIDVTVIPSPADVDANLPIPGIWP